MIENIRKYSGLMAVVFVLLGAGFLFTMGPSRGGGGLSSGPTMLEVNGQALDQTSYERMGSSSLQLASEAGLNDYINLLMAPDVPQLQQAMQLGRFGYNYYTMMRGNINKQDLNRFIANRIILQKAMLDMGIYADDEEVSKKLKESSTFSQNGKFDQAAYTLFVEKRLGRLGMTEKDLHQLVRESLCLNKLISIVGGGLTPVRSAVQDIVNAQNQTVTLTKVVLNRDDFVEKEKPTEEEIKAYWESHKDAYKTDEQRSISYVLLDLPKDTKKADQEKDAKVKAETAEKKRLEGLALSKEITATYQDILDSESAKRPLDFKAIIDARKHKLVKTKLFTATTLPKELQGLTLRGSSNRNRPLSDVIFTSPMSSNDYDRVSDPLPVGEHGWIIFLLDEVVEPVLLDYDAARNKARANLIGENATKKVKQAAKDQRAAILELMKSGKDFDTAAKEKGLTPVQVGPFSQTSKLPKDEPSTRLLHSMASEINPGEVSETIDEADRSLFFYLVKRELEDTETNKLNVDRALQGSKFDFMLRTYLSWMQEQFDNADVKGFATEQK